MNDLPKEQKLLEEQDNERQLTSTQKEEFAKEGSTMGLTREQVLFLIKKLEEKYWVIEKEIFK